MRVVVIGGGAIGGAVACFLAEHPRFSGKHHRRRARPELCPRFLGAGSERDPPAILDPDQYRDVAVRHRLLRDAARTLAVDGETPALGLHESGYLFLATDSGLPVLRDNVALQCGLGADIALLSPVSLRDRFPWLVTARSRRRLVRPLRRGLVRRLRAAASLQAPRPRRRRPLSQGRGRSPATSQADRVTAARLDDGTRLACDVLVNAAGAWAARVAAQLGIDLPVRARRAHGLRVRLPHPLPACPLVIDPTGIWFGPSKAASSAAARPPRRSRTRTSRRSRWTRPMFTDTSGRCSPLACPPSRRSG